MRTRQTIRLYIGDDEQSRTIPKIQTILEVDKEDKADVARMLEIMAEMANMTALAEPSDAFLQENLKSEDEL